MAVVAGTARRIAIVGLVTFVAGGWGVAAGQAAPGAAAPAAPAEHAAPSEHGAAEGGHAAGGHGTHDPTDLSHANATADLENPAEWRYDMALCTFAVFVALLALLGRFAWTPIMRGLDTREQFLAHKHAEAEQAAAQAKAELRAYQDKLAGAEHKAMAIVAQARKDAEAVAEQIRLEAQQAASRERDRAVADIHAAKATVLREVARRSADLAVTLAGRIVRRELRSADHAALITEALEQFPSNN